MLGRKQLLNRLANKLCDLVDGENVQKEIDDIRYTLYEMNFPTFNDERSIPLNQKLTEEEVIWIFTNPERLTKREVADTFGVTVACIGAIWNRINWRQVTKYLERNA